METLSTVRHGLEVSIQQNYFLIGIFKWRHKKPQSGNSTCIINSYTRLYSLGAGLTLFVDSVEVLFAFAHGVCLWCACEQHCTTIKTIKCYPKIIHKIFINWWYVEWLVTLPILILTFLFFNFILITTVTLATTVCYRVDGGLVKALLTATNSVLVPFTFGDQVF